MKNKTILIDGYGFIFRAFHALPPLTDTQGRPIGAIFGFASMLIRTIETIKPTHLALILDSGKTNFRHDIYPEYKKNRTRPPEELISQFPLIRELAQAFNIKSVESDGYEADDIIAYYASNFQKANEEVIIISSDKDLMQLIAPGVLMYDPIKNKYIDKEVVFEKFGVYPEKLLDVLSLMGDSSDNIPGIPGIGPKGAAELINRYGDIETLLKEAHNIPQNKRRESILNNSDKAILSKKLISLATDLPLEFNIDKLKLSKPNMENLLTFLHKYNFKSLIPKLSKLYVIDVQHFKQPNSLEERKEISIINNSEEIADIIEKARSLGKISIEINDLILSIGTISEAFIFFADHIEGLKEALKVLESAFKDTSILKITHNYKFIYKFLKSINIQFDPLSFADITLMDYIGSAGLANSSFEKMVQKHLNIPFMDMSEFSKSKPTAEDILNYRGERVLYLYKLYNLVYNNLFEIKGFNLYQNLDFPISIILAEMEIAGILIDKDILINLSKEFTLEIRRLEEEIFNIVGYEFNVGSPKQLSDVLFKSLNLPHEKVSTKSGNYSTSASILENLSEAGIHIADLLLKWRQITKLQNTYTEVLVKEIDEKTARIHANFIQTSTATGRLSCQEPNLQNIPTRSIEGQKIRSSFIAPKGKVLISADYSQIELRILSHIANVESLKNSFYHNFDIHTDTASKIFNIDMKNVDPEHRRKAKAINFGIIYGISKFGLSKQLNISQEEASLYIKNYFHKYPEILAYMNETKEFARTHGYVKNLFGRRCFVPGINDKNHNVRTFSERAAINAPIQGSTSDLAKLAMIQVDAMIKKNNFKTKILLQIHDEILFESPKEEADIIKPLIKSVMENVYIFSVQVVVGVNIGDNWGEL